MQDVLIDYILYEWCTLNVVVVNASQNTVDMKMRQNISVLEL